MSNPFPQDPTSSGSSERVLLIHGTFAQDKGYWRTQSWWRRLGRWRRAETSALPPDQHEDLSWWRARGEFAEAVDRLGGGRFACDPEEFHWTGANKESQRQLAGSRLLQWLERLEREGARYHLIGHSHGGSVIWHALKQAVARNRELPGLRGWASVGSPFLQFRPAWYDLWLLAPLAAYIALAYWIYQPLVMVYEHRHDLAPSSLAGLIALCTLLSVHAVAFVVMLLRLLSILGAAREEGRDRAARRKAWEAYGPRWRGVWSLADEAIGGLAGSLGLGGAVAPRFPGIDTIRVEGVWDVVMFLPRVLYLGLLGPLYNGLVAPNVDRFVWGTATAQFHGNDRGGVRLAAVWNGPVGNAPAGAGLPEGVDSLLVAEADRHAADVLRQLRAALGQTSATPSDLSALTGVLGGQFASKGLIHTAYFRWPEVQRLLADWVAARLADAPAPCLAPGPANLAPAFEAPGATQAAVAPEPAAPRWRFRPAWAVPFVLAFLPLGVSAYASNALRDALRPYSVEYQVEQIMRDAPYASVAIVAQPEYDPDAMIQVPDSNRYNREEAARFREIADYGVALSQLGRLGQAVEVVMECGYAPPQLLGPRSDDTHHAFPFETLLRTLDGGQLGQVTAIARGQSEPERRAHMLVAVAQEHVRRGESDQAWTVGREALAVFPPKPILESIAPGAPKLDQHAIVATGLAVAGLADQVLSKIRAIEDPDARLAAWLMLGANLSLEGWSTPESLKLAEVALNEVLPHWTDPAKRGRTPLTHSISDQLASLLAMTGRFGPLVSLEETYARLAAADPTYLHTPMAWKYLNQLRESYPIDPGVVSQVFRLFETYPEPTLKVEQWNYLGVRLLEYGNWTDSDKALERAFEAAKARKPGGQAGPGLGPVQAVWDPGLLSIFRNAIVRMRQAGRPDDVTKAAVKRFEETFGESYDPFATGGAGDKVASGIVLRDQLAGNACRDLGTDARAIALAVLAEAFRRGDMVQGPGWAGWAVHEAIGLRPFLASPAVKEQLDALLKTQAEAVFEVDDPRDRYVPKVTRPRDPYPSTGLAYTTPVADQLFSRVAPALARAGLEGEAGRVIGRINDHALRHATWNEAIPHILAAREPDRRDESKLPAPLRAEMRVLEVMDWLAARQGTPGTARAAPGAVVDDFTVILSADEWDDSATLEQRPLSASGRAWLVAHLVRASRLDDALKLARGPRTLAPKNDGQETDARDAAFAASQAALVDSGEFGRAVEFAKLRDTNLPGTTPLFDACEAAAKRGRLDSAREAAAALTDQAQRARAFAMLSWYASQAGPDGASRRGAR